MKSLSLVFCLFISLIAISGCSKVDRSAGADTPANLLKKVDQALRDNDASLMVSCFHEADQGKVTKVIEALFETRGSAEALNTKIDEAKTATQANEIKFVLMEELGIMFSPPGAFSRAVIKEEKLVATANVVGLREPLQLAKVGERWGLDAGAIMHGQSEEVHLRICKAVGDSLDKIAQEDLAKLSNEQIMAKLREIANADLRWVFDELDKAS